MRLHVIQHVPFEDAGRIGDWARERGHEVSVTMALTEEFPSPEQYEMLVVMGGPMGVRDVDQHPWLAAEQRAIAAAVEAGRIVVGVCLGAQLIAHVLGAEVTRNREPEIGWFPVRLTPEARGLPLTAPLPDEFVALHWHGDTFAIPEAATRLASSDACANQAFLYDDRVLALQFHIETAADGLERLVTNCADELVEAPWVRTAEELRAGVRYAPQASELLYGLLDRLAETGVRAG